jgi:hypothetical protein
MDRLGAKISNQMRTLELWCRQRRAAILNEDRRVAQ